MSSSVKTDSFLRTAASFIFVVDFHRLFMMFLLKYRIPGTSFWKDSFSLTVLKMLIVMSELTVVFAALSNATCNIDFFFEGFYSLGNKITSSAITPIRKSGGSSCQTIVRGPS